MTPEQRQTLKQKIVEEIAAQKKLIASLRETSKPVAPDNAIGRLSRMEAINDTSVSEASLTTAQTKMARLETALGKVDLPEFGICSICGQPIPHGRVMLMPESPFCVPCAEKRRG